MRRATRTGFLLRTIALLTMAVAVCTAEDRTPVHGKIVSIDTQTRTLTVKQRKGGDSLILHAPADQVVHVYVKGSREELRPGDAVKTYGKVSPDGNTIVETRLICVMPQKRFGSDGKSRIDGTLILKHWKPAAIRVENREVKLALHRDWVVEKVYAADFGFLRNGLEIRNIYATRRNGQWEAVQELRVYAPRQEVESYLPAAAPVAPVAATTGKRIPVDGEIVSIDPSARTFTLRQKKDGKNIVLHAPADQMFHTYTNASPKDLQTGNWVKLYGKIGPDGKTVDEVRYICIMPEERFINDGKQRMDGQLVVKDGKPSALKLENATVALNMREKWSVQKAFETDFSFLEKGMPVSGFRATEMPGGRYEAVREIRNTATREKVESYLRNTKPFKGGDPR